MRHTRGFSLLETIIAISVIALTIAASAELTQQSLRNGRAALDRIISYGLAQEGLEVVRNMRDSNWLQNRSWRNGIADGTYRINMQTPFALTPIESPLRSETFSRIVTVSTQSDGAIRIESNVAYGGSLTARKSVSLMMELTDWKKGPL